MKTVMSKISRNGTTKFQSVGRTIDECLVKENNTKRFVVLYSLLPKVAFNTDSEYNIYVRQFKALYGIDEYSFY